MKTKSHLLLFGALFLIVAILGAVNSLKCFDCSGDECSINVPNPKACGESEVCFVKNAGGQISRGCIATENCSSPECIACNDDLCNDNLICKTCDGGKDCAQNPNGVSSKICGEKEKFCFTKINDENKTVRGCASEKVSANEDTSMTCEKGLCNNEIFPKNRTQCYQCSPSEECNNLKGVSLLPCEFYDKEEKCTTSGTSEATMQRGCSSDKDNKCTTNNDSCHICEIAGCNNRTFERDQKLKCSVCEGSIGELCAISPPALEAEKGCEKKLKFTQEDNCYTQMKDSKVKRGCLYDMEDCVKDPGCIICNTTDACNREPIHLNCINCRSDNIPDCWNNAQKLGSIDCQTQNASEKCYHGIWNGVAIRGCLSDAFPQAAAACLQNRNCYTCSEPRCNIKKSSAMSWMTINTSLLIAMICIKFLV